MYCGVLSAVSNQGVVVIMTLYTQLCTSEHGVAVRVKYQDGELLIRPRGTGFGVYQIYACTDTEIESAVLLEVFDTFDKACEFCQNRGAQRED